MHKQHPQTAYRKYAILIGTIFENCDNATFKRHLCDMQFTAVALKSWIAIVLESIQYKYIPLCLKMQSATSGGDGGYYPAG